MSSPESKTTGLTVENWPLEKLKPYERNPRVNAGAVDAVASSIRQFGWRVPVIVDREGTIIAGHTRLLAAKKLGLSEVPVHVASDLTPEAAKALRVADNKTGELAEWDFELLPIELKELQAQDWDLSALGFSEDELSDLLAIDGSETGNGDVNAVPEVDETTPPVSKPGEIYALGRHRLLCGDASDADGVKRLLAGKRIDMMFTDPPYAVGYADKNKFLNASDKGNRIQDEIANDRAGAAAGRPRLPCCLLP